jgi:hypothetical protein
VEPFDGVEEPPRLVAADSRGVQRVKDGLGPLAAQGDRVGGVLDQPELDLVGDWSSSLGSFGARLVGSLHPQVLRHQRRRSLVERVRLAGDLEYDVHLAEPISTMRRNSEDGDLIQDDHIPRGDTARMAGEGRRGWLKQVSVRVVSGIVLSLALTVLSLALAAAGSKRLRHWLWGSIGVPRLLVLLFGVVLVGLVGLMAFDVARRRRQGWPPRRRVRTPQAREFSEAFLDLMKYLFAKRKELRPHEPVPAELEAAFLEKRRRVLAARDEIIDDVCEFVEGNSDYDLRLRGRLPGRPPMSGGPERPFAEIWETPLLAAVFAKTAGQSDEVLAMSLTEYELILAAFVRWVERTDGQPYNPFARQVDLRLAPGTASRRGGDELSARPRFAMPATAR